jgi:deoxyribodipyrimidine photo-lyase
VTALVWFRQDLRLADNPALIAAAKSGAVLPVFVLDDATPGRWKLGGASRWWLHGSLEALAASLAKLGAPLVLRRGRWEEVIPLLAKEVSADAVHAGRMHEPWARQADEAISRKVALHLHRTATLFHPEAVTTKTGGIYGVYTPFANTVHALARTELPAPQNAPRKLEAARAPHSETLAAWNLRPAKPDWAGGLRATWDPGEDGARTRITVFGRKALAGYPRGRDVPGEVGTSMLSPHLHWGEISPVQAWHAAAHGAGGHGAGLEVWQRELIWRDFASYQLWHHAKLPDAPLREQFEKLPWRTSKKDLAAWQRGQTGVPIVDAGMRQLWQLGWMHNRVRMIVASFLIKHLLIDWRDGEAWFWDTLVDADLGNNATNWQWVAGCGIDAQPFFRVFNPLTQGKKFDANGAYVRHFVPELAKLPDTHLQAPWEAPADVLTQAGIVLNKTYPRPIVDLAAGRDRALAAFRAAVRGE